MLALAFLVVIATAVFTGRSVRVERPNVERALSYHEIIAYEAERAGVSSRLALAVARVENPSGDSLAVSKAGAVGLMQVLPKYWGHAFEEECGCGALTGRRRNACVGVRALKEKLMQKKTTREALCAYHGSSGYPAACQKYASDVLDALASLP